MESKVLSIVILLLLLSCNNAPNNSQSQNVPETKAPKQEVITYEHIPMILDFLKSYKLDYCCLIDDCYNINSELLIDPSSCSYNTWNIVYYNTFVAQGMEQDKMFKFSETALQRAIDFDVIKDMRKMSMDVSSRVNHASICIKWIEENEDAKTVTFSPLIPYKGINKYEAWMTIAAEEGSPEYKFDFKKENGRLVLTDHSYVVTCDSPLYVGLGDHIKH
jgi:hypothetical protein